MAQPTKRETGEDRGTGGFSSGERPISTVMTREVVVIAPDAGVIEAAGKMKALNIGAIPVCEGDRLIGMVTAGTSRSKWWPTGEILRPPRFVRS